MSYDFKNTHEFANKIIGLIDSLIESTPLHNEFLNPDDFVLENDISEKVPINVPDSTSDYDVRQQFICTLTNNALKFINEIHNLFDYLLCYFTDNGFNFVNNKF